MINLKNMTLPEIEKYFQEIGEKKFRAKQVFEWIYKGVDNFDQMTNLSKPLRDKLAQSCNLGLLKTLQVQESNSDGTRKYLFELEDGNCIESVFMKYKYGNSICVSSQAGCRMGCKFCASTIGGKQRDLTPGEISDQLLMAEKDTGEKINHIVIMGTGEPFDNYENVGKFLYIVNAKEGLNISMRNITVSTCGIIPMIQKFSKDFKQVNLAVSLHGPNDEIRSSIMPINNKYPMQELLDACRAYTNETKRRITFEYALVNGVNDERKHAEELSYRLKGMLCHVNLIPLNKVKETSFDGTIKSKAVEFMRILEGKNIQVTIRRELGSDIDAACGQLRLGKK